jgi:1-acyl-sn-glycerol-3-phosphate acyltransferase
MTWIRSAAFMVAALAWTAVVAVLYLPLLALPRRILQRMSAFWLAGVIALLRLFCGLGYRVRGRANLPDGPCLIAAKHQSAWDTLIFHLLVDDPIYVLKQELLRIPLIGWYLWKAGNIAVDRSVGFRALKGMMPKVQVALAEGAQVIIFPEGTRTPPGHQRPYQPGIAGLYQRCGVPVIPVALNSGLFWGRRRFVKLPGVITIEFLPAMPKGLGRDAFLAELRSRIEEAADRLAAEAGAPGEAGAPVAPIPSGDSNPHRSAPPGPCQTRE